MIGLWFDGVSISLEDESGIRLGVDMLGRRYATATIRYTDHEMDFMHRQQETAEDWLRMAIVFLLHLFGAYLFANGGTIEERIRMARAFLLHLLGAYLFTNGGKTVSLRSTGLHGPASQPFSTSPDLGVATIIASEITWPFNGASLRALYLAERVRCQLMGRDDPQILMDPLEFMLALRSMTDAEYNLWRSGIPYAVMDWTMRNLASPAYAFLYCSEPIASEPIDPPDLPWMNYAYGPNGFAQEFTMPHNPNVMGYPFPPNTWAPIIQEYEELVWLVGNLKLEVTIYTRSLYTPGGAAYSSSGGDDDDDDGGGDGEDLESTLSYQPRKRRHH
ncbi:hypothetical protein SO802_017584 [Lithocarpus litseifolius]|uniref:Uncharacterized protein n=1 Tax=Lithocarpus litseifolius TaxID=425828 RepID=A0AAW2CID0_9ROSI